MREAEAGQIAMLLGEAAQAIDRCRQPCGQHFKALAHEHQIGVVGDIAARRAKMNDAAGRGALIAVSVDVRHHIVPQPAFMGIGGGEIDVLNVLAQLVDLRGAIGNPSSASASASQTQSCRQVRNFLSSPQSRLISGEA